MDDSGVIYAGYNSSLYIPPANNPNTNSQQNTSSNMAVSSSTLDPDTGYGMPTRNKTTINIVFILSVVLILAGIQLRMSYRYSSNLK